MFKRFCAVIGAISFELVLGMLYLKINASEQFRLLDIFLNGFKAIFFWLIVPICAIDLLANLILWAKNGKLFNILTRSIISFIIVLVGIGQGIFFSLKWDIKLNYVLQFNLKDVIILDLALLFVELIAAGIIYLIYLLVKWIITGEIKTV
jgi:hypothetical protein